MNKDIVSLVPLLVALSGCNSVTPSSDQERQTAPLIKKPKVAPSETTGTSMKLPPTQTRVTSTTGQSTVDEPRLPGNFKVVSPRSRQTVDEPRLPGNFKVVSPQRQVDSGKRVDSRNYMAQGYASWYRVSEHGAKTAHGELYNLYGMTAAHASLPLLTKVRVINKKTGRSVIVTINDRLYDTTTLIKLSYWAARSLGLDKNPWQTVSVSSYQ